MTIARRISILVVDHVRNGARPLSELLRETYGPSCVVDAVADVREAAVRAQQAPFDLVLVDRDAAGTDEGALRSLEEADPAVPLVVFRGTHPEEAFTEIGSDPHGLGARLREIVEQALRRPCRGCDARPADRALRTVFNSSLDGILVVDEDQRALFSNPAAAKMFGRTSDTVLGSPVSFRVQDGTLSEIELDTGRTVEMQVVGIAWEGRPAHLATLRDITKRKRAEKALLALTEELRSANQRLQELADVDPLTRLLNRRGLAAVVKREFELSRSAAMLIDCDNFKRINDRYDHVAGDAVLRTVADRLQAALRPTDRLARVGGDEFLVLLPGAMEEEAADIAERLRETVCREPINVPGHDSAVRISVSIGVAGPSRHVRSLDHVLSRTGLTLKHSKHAGKDRVSRRSVRDSDSVSTQLEV